MTQKFAFNLLLPVSFALIGDSDEREEELNKIIDSMSIEVDAEELGLPPVPVYAQYYKIADDSLLPSALKVYFNKSDLIYDVDGFELLSNHFGCPEHLAYSCLAFYCEFEVTDDFIENYEASLDEIEDSVWRVESYTSAFDLDETFVDEKITFAATEIFTELFFSVIGRLLAAINLSMPGCFQSGCAFVCRHYESENLVSNFPDIKAFEISDFSRFIPAEYELNICNKWPEFQTIPAIQIWEWIIKILKFSGDLSKANIKRALNRFFSLFKRTSIYEDLFVTVAALEALYVFPFQEGLKKQREPGKQKQLITHIPLFLDVNEIFPKGCFEDIIRQLYHQRSRLIHGDKDIFDPFRQSLDDESIRRATSDAVLLLISSLRKISELNLRDFSIPFRVKC